MGGVWWLGLLLEHFLRSCQGLIWVDLWKCFSGFEQKRESGLKQFAW